MSNDYEIEQQVVNGKSLRQVKLDMGKEAYQKAYYKAYYKAYRKTDKFKACQKAYQKTDKWKAYQKAYYQKNKEKIIERVRKSRELKKAGGNENTNRKQQVYTRCLLWWKNEIL